MDVKNIGAPSAPQSNEAEEAKQEVKKLQSQKKKLSKEIENYKHDKTLSEKKRKEKIEQAQKKIKDIDAQIQSLERKQPENAAQEGIQKAEKAIRTQQTGKEARPGQEKIKNGVPATQRPRYDSLTIGAENPEEAEGPEGLYSVSRKNGKKLIYTNRPSI